MNDRVNSLWIITCQNYIINILPLYNADVTRATYCHCEVFTHGAAFDEVFVCLRLVELADDGPDGVGRRVDVLGE
ncbi:hypothetical protein HanHA89_Chr17g0688881 [Helianthus annuus]|nr:hypothetical protein HanHA89_Chr17g0688881 [Helianthus annuus]